MTFSEKLYLEWKKNRHLANWQKFHTAVIIVSAWLRTHNLRQRVISQFHRKIRPKALVKYIDHLKHIAEEDEPLLLVAYIYHLYMGLLSGGQILSKKRQFFGSDDGKVKGTAVTTFEGIHIMHTKTFITKKNLPFKFNSNFRNIHIQPISVNILESFWILRFEIL